MLGIGLRASAHDDENDLDCEAEIVAAARSDPAAFTLLYHRYRDPIYRYLRARLGHDEDAADLTQQVFLNAFESLPSYEGRGLPFGAWLFRIARNAAIDSARRHRSHIPLDDLSEDEEPRASADPEAAVLQAGTLDRFRELIAPLDDDKRDLLILRFVAELTTAEIAALVGKRDGAVRVQLSRTLKSLNKSLKERYDAE